MASLHKHKMGARDSMSGDLISTCFSCELIERYPQFSKKGQSVVRWLAKVASVWLVLKSVRKSVCHLISVVDLKFGALACEAHEPI